MPLEVSGNTRSMTLTSRSMGSSSVLTKTLIRPSFGCQMAWLRRLCSAKQPMAARIILV